MICWPKEKEKEEEKEEEEDGLFCEPDDGMVND